MPAVESGESERAYVKRCVPVLIGEGKKADEAVAICHSLWDEHSQNQAKQFSIQSFDSAMIFALDGLKPYEKIQPPSGQPWDRNGLPIGYFRKEILPSGELVDTNGKTHHINESRIDKLIVNFNRAKSLGHLPSIPPMHELAGDGSRNMGHVVDVEKLDGSLYAIEQRIGDDAIKAASRNGSSIGTLTNVVLQDGTVIDEFFDHNACIPNPQLGTKQECTLAASRSKVTPLCLQFSRSGDEMTNEQFDKVKLCFGREAPSDLTKDNAIEKLLALKQPKAEITDTEFESVKLAFGRDVPADLNKDNAVLKLASHAQTLVKPQSKKLPEAAMLHLAGKSWANLRSQMIEKGWTKAAIDAIEETHVKKINPDTLTLSRSPIEGDAELFNGLLSLIDLGEKTKDCFAGLALGRTHVSDPPEGEGEKKLSEADMKKYMAMAGY